MKSRTIDATKFRTILERMCEHLIEIKDYARLKDIQSYIKWLDAQPTVDARPVVHGRFIVDREKDVLRCSVCDYETPTLIPYVCDGVNWVPFFERKYCGNCGAKMDGDT